jgi:hypothetical protein
MPIANKQVAKAVYDFDVDGTASGDIVLSVTENIPRNAKITNLWTNEVTALTGSTDLDIKIGTTDVIAAAVNLGGDAGFQSRTVALPLLTTGGNIMLHNDGSAVTAGKVEVYVEYMY